MLSNLPRPPGECGTAEMPLRSEAALGAQPSARMAFRVASAQARTHGNPRASGVPGLHDDAILSTEHVLRARPCKPSSPPGNAPLSQDPEAGVGLPC